jgi:hypothetical protein
MKLINKLEKTKFYCLVGLFIFIFFIGFTLMLLSNHLLNIKENKLFADFNKTNYEIVLDKKDNCKLNKKELFTYKNYNISGYCINNIYVIYNSYKISLNNVLNKEYLQLDDILSNLELSYEEAGINYYTSDSLDVIKANLYKDQYEVIFLPKD